MHAVLESEMSTVSYERRTGLSTRTVMLSPGLTVVHSAGAPMLMRCASAEAAEAAKQMAVRRNFMTQGDVGG